MRIGIIGDIHIGAQENNENFIDYQMESLKWAYEKFRENNIKNIIYLGDILDKRRQITFKVLKSFYNIFGPDDFEHYILAGNHDCYYKDTNEINSIDLLLEDFKHICTITQEPKEIEIENEKLLFVPWINKTNLEQTEKNIKKSTAKYVFSHLDISGFEMTRGILSTTSSIRLELLDKFNKVITGHYHNYSNKGDITYIGSLCEQNWNDLDIDKFIGVLDTEKDELEKIKSPFKLYHKIVIKNDELEENIEQYRDKNIRIYLYTDRNIKIEKYIDSIIEVAYNVNVIDEQVITNIPDIEVESDYKIINLWKNYLDELEFKTTEKNAINKIFEETYYKVINGDTD